MFYHPYEAIIPQSIWNMLIVRAVCEEIRTGNLTTHSSVNPEFTSSMKEKIEEVIREELGNTEDARTKWEILKHRIRQFSSIFQRR